MDFKCSDNKCNAKFLLRDKMIRCPSCGCRILYKLRTKNSVVYKTE